jgi:hypothetical protein
MTMSQDLKVNWKNVPTRTITAGGVEFAYRELITYSDSGHGAVFQFRTDFVPKALQFLAR